MKVDIGYMKYKTYKTHSGNNTSSSRNGVYCSGQGNNHAEMDTIFDVKQPGTTLHSSGKIIPFGSDGLNGGKSSDRWGDNYYAVSFTGYFKPSESGTYKFRTGADDSHEFMIMEVGDSDDIVNKKYGCCSYVYNEVNLDNNT